MSILIGIFKIIDLRIFDEQSVETIGKINKNTVIKEKYLTIIFTNIKINDKKQKVEITQ